MAKAKKAKKPAAKKAARKPAKAKKAAPKARRAAAPRAAKVATPKWKMPDRNELTTGLVVRDAAAAIEFYKNALGAQELVRHIAPDGKAVWHAELKIGDTMLVINDEIMPGPVTAAGPNHKATSSFYLYTPDCDAAFQKAVAAGGTGAMPPADMFWGDRMSTVVDPFGQVWMIATHTKDMTLDEQKAAGDEFAKKMAQMGQQPPVAPPVASQPPPAAGGAQH